MQTRMKLEKYEWLMTVWQNTRNGFVCEKMKNEEAFGIGITCNVDLMMKLKFSDLLTTYVAAMTDA